MSRSEPRKALQQSLRIALGVSVYCCYNATDMLRNVATPEEEVGAYERIGWQ